MRFCGREAEKLFLIENGREDEGVGRVGPGNIRMGRHDDVSGRQILFSYEVDAVSDRGAEAAEKEEHAVGLGDHARLIIQEREAAIHDLVQIRRDRAAERGLLHAVCDRYQVVSNHGQSYGVYLFHRRISSQRVMTRFRYLSTFTVWPGMTVVIWWGSSTITGPAWELPEASLSRSRTFQLALAPWK